MVGNCGIFQYVSRLKSTKRSATSLSLDEKKFQLIKILVLLAYLLIDPSIFFYIKIYAAIENQSSDDKLKNSPPLNTQLLLLLFFLIIVIENKDVIHYLIRFLFYCTYHKRDEEKEFFERFFCGLNIPNFGWMGFVRG